LLSSVGWFVAGVLLSPFVIIATVVVGISIHDSIELHFKYHGDENARDGSPDYRYDRYS
jgi:hypothetical protein